MTIRAIVIGVATLALAGCGASQHPQASATSQCSHYKAAAQTWAQNYVAPLPAAVANAKLPGLAAAELKVLATSHGLTCN